MKRSIIGFIVFICIVALVGMTYPWFLQRLGSFLIVNESMEQVEAIIVSRINIRAIQCYRDGRCKKIFVIKKSLDGDTWSSIRRLKSKPNQKHLALESGIADEDFKVFTMKPRENENRIRFTYRLLKKHRVQSALVLVRFFKTRRYRFYFDRIMDKNNTITFYVQPISKGYKKKLVHWWKKTTYANYFLSEYLRMFYYYFIKVLFFQV